MVNKKVLFYGATALLLMASCNNSNNTDSHKEQRSTPAKLPDSSKTETISPNEPPANPNIFLTIAGGEMAGNYSAACKEGCCSWGISGDNIFTCQYSEMRAGAKGISVVQLLVDNVKGNKSTKEFALTVNLGPISSKTGNSFNIDTRNGSKKGSGMLNLKYSGSKAIVTIKGISSKGPSIDLKIECDKVISAKPLRK
ncbi:MAG: hypothetical protein ACHQF0_01315 [Chitinophagales bacterium]